MKKLFLIPIFTLLLSSVDAQEIYNSLSKYFEKNKVSKLDNYLIKDGGIKVSHKTLPNLLISEPSFRFDIWEFEEYEERYYIFRSNENEKTYETQIEYIEKNLLDNGKDFYTIEDIDYHAFLQEQDGYEVLMVVINH